MVSSNWASGHELQAGRARKNLDPEGVSRKGHIEKGMEIKT